MLKKKQNDGDPDELSYTVMRRAENGECVINNSRTSTSIEINNSPRYPKLSIGIELAKAMRWIVMGRLGDGEPGYVLGVKYSHPSRSAKSYPSPDSTGTTPWVRWDNSKQTTTSESENCASQKCDLRLCNYG